MRKEILPKEEIYSPIFETRRIDDERAKQRIFEISSR